MPPLENTSEPADLDADIYPWKMAPAHLMTRRQLRAAGLAPGGHAPVAQTETKRRGRRILTFLYDSRIAVPKRTATPAQLSAIKKAIRERRARAAERHGYSRDELAATNDPGPGWTQTPETPTHEEETPMSDNTIDDTTAPQLGAPEGHGQRIAHLLAVVAVNQACQRLDKLAAAVELAELRGPDAVAQLEATMQTAVDAAEARLAATTAQRGPESVAPLADALVFRTGSDVAEARLAQLTSDYAADWGIRIDAEELTVAIDPDFDPVAAQTFAEVECLFDRKSAAVDIVSALPLADAAKTAVYRAISAWHTSIDPDSPRAYLDGQDVPRRQLDADLAAAGLSESDRARVGFVVDFLRGDVSDIDLLASPVFVDPGEETRSRVEQLLNNFAHNPKTAPEVGREISVMTAADQQRVREAGKAIAAGQQVDTELWPEYVDRLRLGENLESYARDIEDLRRDADYLAEGQLSAEERRELGYKSRAMQDETSARIDRIVETREKMLDQAHSGKGLASIERAHLVAVINDIDNGRSHRTELPELLFADEHTKADADFLRGGRAAAQLADTTREAITQRIAATNAVDPDTRAADQLDQAVKNLGSTLSNVASGTRAFSIEQKRTEFAEKRARLGQALTQAGVPANARTEIRDQLDTHARKAGALGNASAARTEQWDTKIAQVAAARDDAIAQRHAADAGRAKPPEAALQQRACTTRIDPHLTTSPGAGIRQLHSQEQGIDR